MANNFDICVIGAGPGGYVAAIHAAKNGAKVALIEKNELGGTCLNVGCIPTKTLIASAEVLHSIQKSSEFGININGDIEIDWDRMLERKSEVVEKLRTGIAGLLKNAEVEVFNGKASFLSSNEISIECKGETQKLTADKTIIATGSKPVMPPFIPKASNIISSTELLQIKKIPKSLIVLGGGVIGCEFACLFASLGTEVTVVEMMKEILPEQDKEVSKLLAREMKKRKIKVLTGKPLENIESDSTLVKGSVGTKEVSAEYMLVSVGRAPVTDSLNCKNAGIKRDERGYVHVDSYCRTNINSVFAIGDITGGIQLAHFASAMAIYAADNACGKKREFNTNIIPGCIFTFPEIGSVGVTEKECVEKDIKIKVGKFNFAALGKAAAINQTAGFCKIITSAEDDKIIGVHIIGAHATDLISEATTVIELNVTAEQLGNIIHPHPTLGEIMMEASHDVHEKSVHVPVRKGTKR